MQWVGVLIYVIVYYSNVKDAQVTRINDSLTYLHSIIHKQYLSLKKKEKKKDNLSIVVLKF